MLNKKTWLKPGKWVWVVQNEDSEQQFRKVALFLDHDHLGDCWVTWKEGNGHGEKFITGQVSVKDLIPLNSCTGWNYCP